MTPGGPSDEASEREVTFAASLGWIAQEEWEGRDFDYSAVGSVFVGRRAAVDALPRALAADGITRVLLITSRTLLERSDLVARLVNAVRIPSRVFPSRAHSPAALAEQAAREAREFGAGAVVVVGGSSATDLAKGASLAVTAQAMPIYCVPTTLSGAEFSANLALTDGGRKTVSRSVRALPRAVFLDPDMVVATPDELWASTGLKLLDHALERILSTEHTPIIDVQSVAGASIIVGRLGRSVAQGPDLADRRAPLLDALWLIQSNAGNVGAGFSHVLSRSVSERYGVPHGIGSALFLAPALRWCAPVARPRFTLVADAVLPGDRTAAPPACIGRVEQLVREVGLSLRLRDAGVPRGDLDAIARDVIMDRRTRTSPWQPRDAADLAGRLEALW